MNLRDTPLVSCLMVSRGDPARIEHSIEEFFKQTHPHKELIIVTDTNSDRVSGVRKRYPSPLIRWVFVPASNSLRLGHLRNISVNHARGFFIAQWDDDDLYDPLRIETQLAAVKRHQALGCILARWLIWWPDKRRLFVSPRRLWEGSLFCQRDKMPSYPNLSKGEDTPVIQDLVGRYPIVMLDAPILYVYVVHGLNTWHERHFEEIYQRASLDFSGPFYERQLAQLSARMSTRSYPVSSAAPSQAEIFSTDHR